MEWATGGGGGESAATHLADLTQTHVGFLSNYTQTQLTNMRIPVRGTSSGAGTGYVTVANLITSNVSVTSNITSLTDNDRILVIDTNTVSGTLSYTGRYIRYSDFVGDGGGGGTSLPTFGTSQSGQYLRVAGTGTLDWHEITSGSNGHIQSVGSNNDAGDNPLAARADHVHGGSSTGATQGLDIAGTTLCIGTGSEFTSSE